MQKYLDCKRNAEIERTVMGRQSNSNENMDTFGAFFGKSCGRYSAYFDFFQRTLVIQTRAAMKLLSVMS